MASGLESKRNPQSSFTRKSESNIRGLDLKGDFKTAALVAENEQEQE